MADALLRGPLSLTPGKRELIAAYTSERNRTPYCSRSHSFFAAAQLDGGAELVRAVLLDAETAPLTPRLKALLRSGPHVFGPRLGDASVSPAAQAAGPPTALRGWNRRSAFTDHHTFGTLPT